MLVVVERRKLQNPDRLQFAQEAEFFCRYEWEQGPVDGSDFDDRSRRLIEELRGTVIGIF